MSNQITPGPWLAEPADMFGDHNIVLADGPDARAIAAVVSNMRHPAEVAANARAIALVPEMVEALRRVRDVSASGADTVSFMIELNEIARSCSAILSKLEAPHG